MSEMKEIVKLAVDLYHGRVEKYSAKQGNDLLRQALIEANNGSTKLDFRAIRDGKCTGLFTLIEEILTRTVVEGLQGDEFFNTMVEFRNVAEGDKNLFLTEDSVMFIVDDTADGNQAVRRQRLSGVSEKSIPTSMKTVRIYEELNRVLAGRVDFNDLINKVAESFRQKILNDIYTLWESASATEFGNLYFPAAGSYTADNLLDMVAHVEAAAGGKPATIIGTKKALRKIAPDVNAQSESAKDDLYKTGYYGTFYGTPVVAVPNRHRVGSTDFVMDDNTITVIAGDEKPIKFVYEGDPLVIMGDPLKNTDLTQEYFYGEKYGLGIILAGGNSGIGRYKMAA